MGYEYTIDKVVNPIDIDNLKKFATETGNAATAYSNLASIIASGIKTNPSTLMELMDKQNKYHETLKKLVETQNNLASIQEKQLAVLGRIEKSIADNTKITLQSIESTTKETESIKSKTNAIDKNISSVNVLNQSKKIGINMDKEVADLISKTLGTRSDNLRMLAKEQNNLNEINKEKKSVVGVNASLVQREIEVKNSISEVNAVLKNQEKILNAVPGSFEDVSLSLDRMVLAYGKLNRSQKDSSAGQSLLATIGGLTGRVNEYKAAIKKVVDSSLDLSKVNELLRDQESAYASMNANLAEKQHRILSEVRATEEAAMAVGQKNVAERSYLATAGDVANLVNNTLQSTERRITLLIDEKRKLAEVKINLDMVKKAMSENLISTEAAAKSETILVLRKKQHELAIRSMEQALDNEQKLLLAAADSGKESALMLERMRIAYRSLSSEVKAMPVGQQLQSDIAMLDKQVKASDASIGNHQRNVGNYKLGFDGLGMSVQQVARELPSLAIGWNTFFLAISNNLPILVDEIGKAKKEYKGLKEEGIKGTPVWKQVAGSIFSFQTLLVAGITILSVYGKDIINWVGALGKANNALKDTKRFQSAVNQAIRDANKDLIKETMHLDLLYKAANNANKSNDERVFAVRRLKSEYPDYFGMMDDEEIKAGKVSIAYRGLVDSIMASAKARRMESLVSSEQEKYLDYLGETTNASMKLEEAKKRASKANAALEESLNDYNVQEYKDAFNNLRKAQEGYDSASEKSIAQLKRVNEIASSIDVSKLYGDPKNAESASVKNKEFWEIQRKNAISVLESIDEKELEVLTSGKVDGIGDEVVKKYKDAIKMRDEANKKISIYDDLNKTNKEIEKEAESHAKYLLRVENELAKAKATAIEQQRESEIEGVRAEYSKKASLIKGGLEVEKDLRKAYVDTMNKEIADINNRYDSEIETGNIDARISVLKDESDRELDERLGLLLKKNEILREAEVREAEKTGKDVLLVNEKYDADFVRIIKENAEKRVALIDKNAKFGVSDLENAMNEELNSARLNYQLGLKSKEEYERDKFAISVRYLKKQLELQIRAAEQAMQMDGISAEKKKEYEREIASLRNDLAVAGMDATDNAVKNSIEATKRWWDEMDWRGKTTFVVETFADMFDRVSELISNIYSSQVEEIEAKQEKNKELGDAEIDRIDKMEQSGAISKEEAEARKRAAADRTAAKDAELAKKRAELQTKQAKMEKANAIVQTIIATALAIIKAMPNIPLSIMAGVTGAASLATIIAQPIPKYAKGTDNHPGGPAIVGDGGKEEMIIAGGRTWVTPSVPTLVDIPKGAVVLPDVIDLESIRRLRSDVMLLHNESGNGSPITVNVNNDYKSLEQKFDKLGYSFEKMAKSQRRAMSQADLRSIGNRL